MLKYLALMLFLPMAVQAAPLIEGGPNNNIVPGTIYSYDETLLLSAGVNSFDFTLTPLGSPGNALTTNISLEAEGVTFGNFTITGPGGPFDAGTVIPGVNGFLAFINDAPWVVGSLYNLNLTFSLAEAAETLVNVQVNAVPLPAAGFLLLGALGGLGLIRRLHRV